MAERLKAPVLKTGEGASPSWVRIPLCPNFSSELANCMPPLLQRPRHTRLSSQAHPYTVQTPFLQE